jgi:ankyrin repeat protein
MRTTHWLIYSQVTKLLCERGANLNARDSWGYTPLQRAATNDCVDAAKALLAAGASLEISSGLDGDGDNAYELAKRLRSYDCIFAFDDHIAAVNA